MSGGQQPSLAEQEGLTVSIALAIHHYGTSA